MYKESFLILIFFILAYPFFNQWEASSVVYYAELGVLVFGYLYCLVVNLHRLKRTSPEHEYLDEEEEKIFKGKKE